MAVDTRTRSLVQQHSKQRESIALALLKALLGLWGGFKDWDDPLLVAGNAARSATLVDVQLARTRRLARSYATAIFRDNNAMPRSLGKQVDLYPRSGTTMTSVYSRVARVYLRAIEKEKSPADAQKEADRRLEQMLRDDIAAAERDELNAMWNLSSEVIGWRRIIHPELSESGTCGLCVVAATRFYTRDDLKALHGGCKCDELPIFKSSDPGLQLNEDDLKTIYAAAGSTAAEDLRDTRITFQDHGELGPILVREGDHFRDVTEVNKNAAGRVFTPYERPTKDNQSESWVKTIESSTRAIQELKAAIADDSISAAKKRDYAAAIKNHTDLIDRMKAKLR